MTLLDNDLSPMQTDALRELGNIGAGNAATALAQLIGKQVNISVPSVRIVKLEQFTELVGGGDQVVAAVSARLLGQAQGAMMVLLPRGSALTLDDLLLGQPAGSTKTFTEMGISALLELGNILMGTYLTAVSNLLGILLMPSVPAFSFDLAGAVVEHVVAQLQDPETRAIAIHTEFQEQGTRVQGHLLFAPDAATLEAMLDALSRLTEGKSQ